jgi:hypothetical protein
LKPGTAAEVRRTLVLARPGSKVAIDFCGTPGQLTDFGIARHMVTLV